MRQRGFTLIELMITVAILGIVTSEWGHIESLRQLTHRQAVREALVRVIENELELAVACGDTACLKAWASAEGTSIDDDSWARAQVERSLGPGPAGTWRAEVTAKIAGEAPQISAHRIVWVSP